MKILYIGDFISKNGPSMVDINLFDNLKKEEITKEQINKIIDINFLKKIYFNEIILTSGVSLKGAISSLLGKILRKKVLFVMHGSLKKESNFRAISLKRKAIEYCQIKFSSKIICVSENFSKEIKKIYPKFVQKIIFINNGIDLENNKKNVLKENIILTVGGGRKEKGVLDVAKAVSKIESKKYILIVVGENGRDTDEIKKFDFVKYLNFLEHDKLMLLMEKAEIFVQNSDYEPFGIAPLEAAARKCKLILSQNVSSKVLLKEKTYYCIKNNKDIDEIKRNLEASITEEKFPAFKEKRTWEKVAQEYIRVIKRCFD